MAVSLGTVFVLNSVALFLFPVVGYALHLTQSQFGLWSALAIHDTSSVVGATAKYGSQALMIGTTIKLARALWIVPVAFAVTILPCRGCWHLSAVVRLSLSKTQHSGKDWVDGYSLSDRHRDFKSNIETSGRASFTAGNLALGNCGDLFSRSHPPRAHLNLTHSPKQY